MNERLRLLRKALGKTQRQFGEAIDVRENTVCIWEGGSKKPADRTVKQICQRFSVTGEGEMFTEGRRKQQIANFVSDIAADNSMFKLRLISALAGMNQEEWDALEKLVDQLGALQNVVGKFSDEK